MNQFKARGCPKTKVLKILGYPLFYVLVWDCNKTPAKRESLLTKNLISRFDSHTVLGQGMVVTIESATSYPGVGGFRHSDSFIITGSGKQRIADYSTELKT